MDLLIMDFLKKYNWKNNYFIILYITYKIILDVDNLNYWKNNM